LRYPCRDHRKPTSKRKSHARRIVLQAGSQLVHSSVVRCSGLPSEPSTGRDKVSSVPNEQVPGLLIRGIDHRLTRTIDDHFCVKSRENSARLPQNSFWGAFSRYRAPYAESQGSKTRFPGIRWHGLILNATEVTSAPEGVLAAASWMRRRRNERGLSDLIVPQLQPLSKMTFLALGRSLSRRVWQLSPNCRSAPKSGVQKPWPWLLRPKCFLDPNLSSL
jgi:hypothetical protein